MATAALVSANRVATTSKVQFVLFGAAVNLSANTGSAYRIVITTSSTSATAAAIAVATITAAHMAMLPLSTAMYHTQHDGTSWTDNTGKRAGIGLLVSKLDDGLGGGRAISQIGLGL